ncbi:hydoxy methyltransferase [Carnobacterium divergens]|uniref:Serine hydroxymethyltransferase-like domain-containing protein n=2 Tax=Carnobacterium divergens TaxID=2748 RepID=A0A7Z8D0D2_CARDV|nr:hydoxy methyltransferase [Carnobacterium divergens]TFI74976.1 hypothetical protein CKN58_01650 [Carnobacterium divergens]TFI79340.1 hypothetical protein CKN85_01655 [Carnobacterium divergens]TFI85672.1 hypothetical protein CKN56_01655 [Carnobacterium divergens]TFI98272.1 hypothetical protein CKN64_01655 [Carnobacterium divergens]TFJ14401.1 hypothetical protein CKN60_01650 [Carnobacterium divergens]
MNELKKLEYYQNYQDIEKCFLKTKINTLPLCAAENLISPFVKIPLSSDYQERYIMNGLHSYDPLNNFIGSTFLFDIYHLINLQCTKLFGSIYADARTLSGMNCVTSLLMSITENGDKIMVSDSQCGGHQSMKNVCERLGLIIFNMPFDFENYSIDYDETYQILKKENINYFLYAPSDIINPPNYSKLKLPENTVFLYDASQTLGLIAGNQLDNPLITIDNSIVFGGTHKTLPGPANGLIMTCSKEWALKIDSNISPKYIRHTQMHQVVSLLYALFEMEIFGVEYSKKIINYAQELGLELRKREFDIPFIGNQATYTHQIFIKTSEKLMNTIYSNAFKYNITLNKKVKKLFDIHGIRLGTQEIARLKWDYSPIKEIANIIDSLKDNQKDTLTLMDQLNIPREIEFTFKTEAT